MKEDRQKMSSEEIQLNESKLQNQDVVSNQITEDKSFMADLASANFPYFFEESQRIQWMHKQQQQNKTRAKLSKSLYHYIVVQLVKNFRSLNKSNVSCTWIINKRTMEVQHQRESQIPKPQLSAICKQLQKKNMSNIRGSRNFKIQNLVFFGRCETQYKSIRLEDNKVSNKHIVLKKNENAMVKQEKSSLYSFLLCWKRLIIEDKNQDRCSIGKLGKDLIKNISSYLSISNQNTYSIFDNSSKNGSSSHLTQYNLTQCKNKIKVSKALESLSLRVTTILARTKLSINSLNMKVDQQIASIFMKNSSKQSKIFNRNLGMEKSQDNAQILILNIQTPKLFKIYILYSQEELYNIYKPKYDLNIEKCNRLVGQEESKQKVLGTIEFSQSWYLKPVRIDDFSQQFVPEKEYTIKDKAFVKLSQATKLVIDVNILS